MQYGRKTEPASIQGTCTVTGCSNRQVSKGDGKYRALCRKHWAAIHSPSGVYRSKKDKYRDHKKTYCEDCGPEIKYHPCQLDVDHNDGDHTNDDPENLKTRCANCHRLKTFLCQEGMYQFR